MGTCWTPVPTLLLMALWIGPHSRGSSSCWSSNSALQRAPASPSQQTGEIAECCPKLPSPQHCRLTPSSTLGLKLPVTVSSQVAWAPHWGTALVPTCPFRWTCHGMSDTRHCQSIAAQNALAFTLPTPRHSGLTWCHMCLLHLRDFLLQLCSQREAQFSFSMMRSTEVGPGPLEPDPTPDVLSGFMWPLPARGRWHQLLLVWSIRTSLGMNYTAEQRLWQWIIDCSHLSIFSPPISFVFLGDETETVWGRTSRRHAHDATRSCSCPVSFYLLQSWPSSAS